jgi:D-lactate dehydrogenase
MKQPVQDLKAALSRFIEAKRLIDDPLRLLTYGTDASFYRLVPQLVVKVMNESEVSRLLALATELRTPVTFRAAGTSLSGQAVTESVLVMLEGNAWRDFDIGSDAGHIRLQPGIIGAQANRWLAPFNRKIGPDPASIASCMIGGIAANNASGMCCGVAQNSYQTLQSMRLVLADGSILDTGSEASREAFRASHGPLLEALAGLVSKVRADVDLRTRIARKFRIKNTTGYSLNALVDYDDPIDVLQHLMIGSEGTLGFIAEITFTTVPEHPHKASALVFFPSVAGACEAVARLKSEPVDAVEIMDRAALRSVQDRPGMPDGLSALPGDCAALLIETRAPSAAQLAGNAEQIAAVLDGFATLSEVAFTDVPAEYELLWKVRKGLFPSVGAVREAGTTVVIEDVAFPLPRLAEGTLALQDLFERHGYDNAIIFGHALEGNLHFVITPDFADPAEVDRYRGFMDELCHLVVGRFDGSLKAEHSTGRNIAPFVELEWGVQAYGLMRRIKELLDPVGILNPGVIFNDDPDVHVKNLKSMSPVDPLVDRCIECGFCEPVCPSRDLTLSPRQRIVALRERARLAGVDSGETDRLPGLGYAVEQTCAGDGLCATRCPVGIDTGEMVRTLRKSEQGAMAKGVAGWVAGHMGLVTAATRGGLAVTHALSRLTGEPALEGFSSGLSRLSGGRLPQWHRWMPRPGNGRRQPASGGGDRRCVYFSACISRSMGTASADDEDRDLIQVMHSLLAKAGYRAIYPAHTNDRCCGLPFKSKGLVDAARGSAQALERSLWEVSEEGRLPVLCDTSPCTARMREQFERPLALYEPAGFIRRFLLPELEQVKKLDRIALHLTCSARKMGVDGDLLALAEQCADAVFLPEEEGCCGFAGDKGFVLPELNAAALSRLKQQLPAGCEQGYSNSRSCEIGLSLHSGIPYRSIAYLVDRCFAAKAR